MGTILPTRNRSSGHWLLAGTPAIAFLLFALWISLGWPAWGRMWALAVAIYASFKWLTYVESKVARKAGWPLALGYLFCWTGMDAEEFFSVPSKYSASRRSEWHWSAVQLLVGFWLLAGLAPRLAISQPAVAGWLAMTGVVSVLHFGVSHLLSLLWRSGGVNARHIMDKPVLARSVSDFWGRR